MSFPRSTMKERRWASRSRTGNPFCDYRHRRRLKPFPSLPDQCETRAARNVWRCERKLKQQGFCIMSAVHLETTTIGCSCDGAKGAFAAAYAGADKIPASTRLFGECMKDNPAPTDQKAPTAGTHSKTQQSPPQRMFRRPTDCLLSIARFRKEPGVPSLQRCAHHNSRNRCSSPAGGARRFAQGPKQKSRQGNGSGQPRR